MHASFEEFIELAEHRFERAMLAVLDGARISAATCDALAAVVRALNILSTRYGRLPDGTSVVDWQPAFVDSLHTAERSLRHHAHPVVAPSAADELISDAARFVATAQDLLATHLSASASDMPQSFARTSAGADLLDQPVRAHLLGIGAEHANQLAALISAIADADELLTEQPSLADAYVPRGRALTDAAHALVNAAAMRSSPVTARLELAPAPALTGPLVAPQPREDLATAAEQAQVELQRLATAAYQAATLLQVGQNPVVHTAGDLRQSAAHLALAHVLAADLLTRLAPYLPASPSAAWADAAGQLRTAGAAWAALRRPWQQTASVPDAGPRSPLTLQARNVVARLGRILYAAPDWSPEDGPGLLRAVDELLAGHVVDSVCALLSAVPRAAVTIATQHGRLVAAGSLDLYSSSRAHRPEGAGRRFYPLQPAQRSEFEGGYREAAHACRTAATSLVPLTRGSEALRTAAPSMARRSVAHLGSRQIQPTPPRPHQPASGRSIARGG